jgi:hypothetical protein
MEFGAKWPGGMKTAETKTAVPLSAGERFSNLPIPANNRIALESTRPKRKRSAARFTGGEKEFAVATDVD